MSGQDLAFAQTQAWTPPEAQRIAGRYEVLGFLGAGGMGSVFRVRDVTLDEVVALKMMRGGAADATEFERFRREVKLARRVTHRNVARAFDVGEHGAERFLTMELVDGESLAFLLERDGALPVERAVAITRDLAEGLGAAHAAGVVHRDLKPANVIIERGGRVVITDFGIARSLDTSESARAILGTPAYMAPEQAAGDAEVGPAADVYALGAVLYELLTGEPAWTGATALATVMARLQAPPPDPRVRAPRTPAPLAALVLRWMAARPELRPADGNAALAELARLESRPEGPLSMRTPESIPIRQRVARVAPVPAERRRVAVLPVRVSPADDVLAEELTEDLADRLSMTGNVRVRPAATVRAASAVQSDACAVGRAVDVEVVVEATLRISERGAALSARAIETSDGFLLWAKRFEGTSGEVFPMIDKVAHAVGAALSVDVGTSERRPLTDPHALEAYVAARHALRAAWTGMLPLGPVVASFDAARALAPDDPLILSGSAMARARAVNYDPAASDAMVAEAEALAARALELAPDAGEPWLAVATLRHRDGRWTEAVTALRQALRRAPALVKAQELLGMIEAEAGELDEAAARFEAALALDPSAYYTRVELTRRHALDGRWDLAAQTLGAPPEEPTARRIYAWHAARLNLWCGRELCAPVALPDAADVVAQGARAYQEALGGRLSTPLAVLESFALSTRPGSRFRAFLLQCLCELACATGDTEAAVRAVETAGADRLFDLAWLDRCPLLTRLRGDARFQAARTNVVARVTPVRAALLAPL